MDEVTGGIDTSFQSILGTVGSLPLDALIIGTLFLFFLCYTFFLGRNHTSALIIALYLSAFLYYAIPFIGTVETYMQNALSAIVPYSFAGRMGAFAALVIVTTIAIARGAGGTYVVTSLRRFFDGLIFGALATAATLALMHYGDPLFSIHTFSPVIEQAFKTPLLIFLWLFGPLVGLFFFYRREFSF